MAGTKVIKVSEENYRWLSDKAAELQKVEGRPVSLDEALSLVKGKRSILAIAGGWKMTDPEAAALKKELREMWKTWKLP